MLLKKVIQNLRIYSEQHEEKEIFEKLSSYKECYSLLDFNEIDPFVRFWQAYRLLHIQVTYLFERTKKMYKVLVEKVLSTVRPRCTDASGLGKKYRYIELSIHYENFMY